MSKKECKMAIDNRYLSLMEQEIIEEFPTNKKRNNETDKVYKTLRDGKYIDQWGWIYGSDGKRLLNSGELLFYLSTGWSNVAFELIDNLEQK